MEAIKITVVGNEATAQYAQPLVAGTVGLPVEFSFDAVWDNLSKVAVFRAGNTVMDRLDTQGAAVPWELLKKTGCTLYIGVYGANADGTLQIPTVWASVGEIQPGADPSGEESAIPTAPVWQQVFNKVDSSVEQAMTRAKESGSFDGKSAYEYAVENGYTGTEQAFGEKLAEPSHPVLYADFQVQSAAYDSSDGGYGETVCSVDYATLRQAYEQGRTVIGRLDGAGLTASPAEDGSILFAGWVRGYQVQITVAQDTSGTAQLIFRELCLMTAKKDDLVQDVIAALPIYNGEVEAV